MWLHCVVFPFGVSVSTLHESHQRGGTASDGGGGGYQAPTPRGLRPQHILQVSGDIGGGDDTTTQRQVFEVRLRGEAEVFVVADARLILDPCLGRGQRATVFGRWAILAPDDLLPHQEATNVEPAGIVRVDEHARSRLGVVRLEGAFSDLVQRALPGCLLLVDSSLSEGLSIAVSALSHHLVRGQVGQVGEGLLQKSLVAEAGLVKAAGALESVLVLVLGEEAELAASGQREGLLEVGREGDGVWCGLHCVAPFGHRLIPMIHLHPCPPCCQR